MFAVRKSGPVQMPQRFRRKSLHKVCKWNKKYKQREYVSNVVKHVRYALCYCCNRIALYSCKVDHERQTNRLLKYLKEAVSAMYQNERCLQINYFHRSGCRSDPCSVSQICGANAECRNTNGRPVCECLAGHKGDPYTSCVRGERDPLH